MTYPAKLNCSAKLTARTSYSGRWTKIKHFYNLGSSRFEILRMESCGRCCCCAEKYYNVDAPDL